MMKKLALSFIVLLSLFAFACGATSTDAEAPIEPAKVEAAEVETFGMKNGRSPLPGVLTAGQPTLEQLKQAADAGYRTVVNLRAAGEDGQIPDAEAAIAELGMRYVHIPIAGIEDINEANAKKLAEAMSETPVLVHCASSNRVGALLAVKAIMVDGVSEDEAMELGRAGGMTRLESAVQGMLNAGH